MRNFTLYNPTRILFGRGQIARIAELIPAGTRILLTYGGGSIFRNGVHAQVTAALAGRPLHAFGGIEPNPTVETLLRAVEVVRRERIDFLLAVGGGSVLDGSKFIAAAALFDGDPWDILARQAPIRRAIPLGTVLTLPASGSEMNMYGVISRRASQEKLSFGSPLLHPAFSVLDPETTFSLPPRQVGNGIVDAFTHVIEQYLTYPADAPLQDRMAEAILRTLIEVGPKTLAAPSDYDARATFMWCTTMALNGLVAAGVPEDWATHTIAHEITALHGLDHAQTLAIVLPGLLTRQRGPKRDKLLQYAERVWDLRGGDDDERIMRAIARTRGFFEAVGVPTRLAAYGVSTDTIPVIAQRLEARGETALGERHDITPAIVEEILALGA